MNDPLAYFAAIHARFAGCGSPAALHVDGDLSFDTLYRRSCAIAAKLSGDRSPVLIRGHKQANYLPAWWGCLLAARPLIAIEPDLPVGRIRDVVAACGAGVIIELGEDHLEPVDGLSVLDLNRFDGAADNVVPVPRAPDDVAYVMFSSGTSGNPKGIKVSYANLADFVQWVEGPLLGHLDLSAVSGNVRYCFDVSQFELWVSWTRRIPISVLDHAEFINSRKYIGRYAQHGVGLWISTPSAIQFYMRDRQFNGANLPDLKTFLFCGEILPKPLVEDLHKRFPGCDVINTYGPTECTVAVTSVTITQDHLDDARALPIGVVRDGCAMYLENGQIVIQGRPVGPGYVGLPERQAKAFPTPDSYRTGDIGTVDDGGNWYFHGRADREIKLQGIRVDLNEIELQIRSMPGVEAAVVDPHRIRDTPRALNAYVCGPANSDGLARLAQDMALTLPAWMVPRFWFGCAEMQFNHNTKLDRADFMAAAHAGDLRYVHD